MTDSTGRFSNRAADYVKGRPAYPTEVVQLLLARSRLGPDDTIADIGSGTGILTRLLLETGRFVRAVEPNEPMRSAAEEALRVYPRFRSIAATAENTGLGAASVGLITVAQAFHWFDPQRTRAEFQRILRPQGLVALIWNDRRVRGSCFAEDYEDFLHAHASDLKAIANRWVVSTTPQVLNTFFGTGGHAVKRFDNHQVMDEAILQSRVLSSSYMPHATDQRYPVMISALRALFAKHQRAGRVVMEYETAVYFGRLT